MLLGEDAQATYLCQLVHRCDTATLVVAAAGHLGCDMPRVFWVLIVLAENDRGNHIASDRL